MPTSPARLSIRIYPDTWVSSRRTGSSPSRSAKAGTSSVTKYWWVMGTAGRSTAGPAQAATWRAYVPAALTTCSQTYDPASVSTLQRPSGQGHGTGDPGVAPDGRPPPAGALREGEHGPGGIHMTVVRRVERSEHAVEVAEGMEFGDPPRADHLHAVAHPAAHRHRVSQPVKLVVPDGEAQRAGLVPAHRPAGLRLQLGVPAGPVPRHPRQAVTRGRMGYLAGGVPGRSRSQLALLQQEAVVPTLDSQVVEERCTHDPPSDDDHPGGRRSCLVRAPSGRKYTGCAGNTAGVTACKTIWYACMRGHHESYNCTRIGLRARHAARTA